MAKIKTYANIAKGYNELYGREQCVKAGFILNRLELKPEDTLLDVGCGTGISTSLFGCGTTGIDPTIELLRQNRHQVVQGVAEYLPFKDNAFDIVASLTAAHNFFDIRKGLSEMSRVARDRVVITVLRKSAYYSEICETIKKVFDIEDSLNETKDTIFFCRKKSNFLR